MHVSVSNLDGSLAWLAFWTIERRAVFLGPKGCSYEKVKGPKDELLNPVVKLPHTLNPRPDTRQLQQPRKDDCLTET